jgi:hypothetical protein
MTGLFKRTVGLVKAGLRVGKDIWVGATELVSPSPGPSNPLDSFREAGTRSVAILQARTINEASELSSSLAFISTTLLGNLQEERCPFIDDLCDRWAHNMGLCEMSFSWGCKK